MQFGFFAKLRAFWVLLPVPNQNAPSNHRPQMIMAWGRPSGRTVTIQYSRDSVRVFTAHFHGNIPVCLLGCHVAVGTLGGVSLRDEPDETLGAGKLCSCGENASLTAGVGRRTAIDTSVG